MLAPVARLLEITPDILLSFQEDVSQEEINQIVQEVDEKFRKEESYEDIFQFVKKKIARYPNSERLYRKQGKTQDAYRTYEELIFQGHNMLEIAMQNIQFWSIEDGNMEKARFMTEKLKNMENLFDMGDYYKVSAELSLAQAEKDADATAACMEKLLDSAGKLDAYASSPLYEHMEFKPLSPDFAAHLKETLQKSAREDESYSFMKGNKK